MDIKYNPFPSKNQSKLPPRKPVTHHVHLIFTVRSFILILGCLEKCLKENLNAPV